MQQHYEGHWKGWALKIETFLGPEMARAKRVPFGAKKVETPPWPQFTSLAGAVGLVGTQVPEYPSPCNVMYCVDSSLGRVPACNAGDPGSIPGGGKFIVCLQGTGT